MPDCRVLVRATLQIQPPTGQDECVVLGPALRALVLSISISLAHAMTHLFSCFIMHFHISDADTQLVSSPSRRGRVIVR